MTYEVKIKEVNKSINLIHHSHIDLGIFTVNATTYSMLYPSEKEDWGVDITDTELIFQVNNKSCKYKGFMELYNQLHGNGSFRDFERDLCEQIDNAVVKNVKKQYSGTLIINL